MRGKIAITSLILLFSSVTASFIRKTGYSDLSDVFGRPIKTLSDSKNKRFHTIIDDESTSFHKVTEQHSQMLERVLKAHEHKDSFKPKDSVIEQCMPSNPDFFKFAAKTVAKLTIPLKKETLNDSFCFETIKYWFTKDTEKIYTIWVETKGMKTANCTEAHLFSLGKKFHYSILEKEGTHLFTFKDITEQEVNILNGLGIEVYRFCDSVSHFVPDLVLSLALFFGGLGLNPNIPFFGSHVPMKMQELNVKFIKHATGFQWRERQNIFIDLNPEDVRSGDFFGITRFDGIDNIIHYGAGSHAGHSVIALWDRSGEQPELYILESQDAVYWPTAGLQRTKFEIWKKQANNADFNVVHLPLRDEYAEKFDEEKAWAWFKETEGMPYGFRNFLFSFLDTETQNLPPVLDMEFAVFVFSLLDRMIPGSPTDRLYKEALNWRLGTKDLDLYQLKEVIAERGLTFGKVFAMVETDKVMYSDGYSYVCSAYVASFYKQSGMLGDVEINPPEFTPRDVYILNIFKSGDDRPQVCRDTDPDLPYCQIMGSWKMDLPGFNTITPYSNMMERCPTLAPDYFRPDGC